MSIRDRVEPAGEKELRTHKQNVGGDRRRNERCSGNGRAWRWDDTDQIRYYLKRMLCRRLELNWESKIELKKRCL